MGSTAWRSCMLAAGLLSALATAGMASKAEEAPPAAVPGGWSEADVDNPGVRAAAQAAVAQLDADGASLASIDSAEQQVVAGVNYHMLLTLSDGRQWDVTVLRKLDYSLELTGATPVESAKPMLRMQADGLRLDSSNEAGEAIPFGTPQEEVIAALAFRGDAELGTNEDCGAGAVDFASWKDGLSLLFQDGQFLGWSLDKRSSGVALSDGTAIGTTLAEMETAGKISVEESTLGEEFLTAAGVSGILSGKGTDARVEALWAGLSCVFR